MILLSCILCILGVFLWVNRMHWQFRIYQQVKNIPGPPSIPFIGNFLPYVGTLDFMWSAFTKLAGEYDGIFKMWTVVCCSIFITDPHYIEVLLSSTVNLQKSDPYDFLKSWLGTGLLISSGDKWKSRRKILTPAFHFNILKEFVSVFEEQSERSVQLIHNECDKSSINVIPLASEHALSALCETTMGIKMDMCDNSEYTKYKNAIYDFGEIFMNRLVNPLIYINLIFNLSKMGRITKNLVTILQKFTLNVIDERLKNWDSRNPNILRSASGKHLVPMMDILISQMKNGAQIDYNGIREEVDTFMFEGHDTTSMGLSFMLMLLANNPDVQNKILAEQNAIFGDSKRTVTYEDLQNMKYLEMVIKETLRLYPPVPFIGRCLDEDLKMGIYTVPAEVYVHVSIYNLHHNPKYWDNPEQFNPDRFLPENCINRHPFAYIPFSAGSRNCIGQRFVMLEMKSLVSKIIREYVLEPVDSIETIILKVDIVIRPMNPIRVKFRRRTSKEIYNF